ncbi:FAD-dependent oxidoreductase [Cardiobacteriaceae bacterium TAE3-ERU3]|nr:FAD-dependent oxidoreductase [Cardiobacteriaceae bacterium TAE3-ERU3]
MKQADLLLIGGGHAHLVAMREWLRKQQRPTGTIALIMPSPHGYYSGRLPAWLAGRAELDDCSVDIAALCQRLDIELVIGSVHGFDAAQRLISSDNGSWQGRVVSFDTGAALRTPEQIEADTDVLGVKPFDAFVAGIEHWRQQPEPIAVIGGGAAGVELALALAQTMPDITLISSGKILPEQLANLREKVCKALVHNGITLIEHAPINHLAADGAYVNQQKISNASCFILTTGAAAQPFYRNSGLALDDRGFVRIRSTLQSISHANVFAAGDCASLSGADKSGVYAVRQGSILAENLSHALSGKPLLEYSPQPNALALLADGKGGAFMSWRGYSAQGRWCGWWKNYLDNQYLRSMQA